MILKNFKIKQYLLVACLLLLASCGFSQSLIFCEKVDSMGSPQKPSHIFTISKKGGFFEFLVVLTEAVNTAEAKFDIYSVDQGGKETYVETATQPVQKEWVWFSKPVTF